MDDPKPEVNQFLENEKTEEAAEEDRFEWQLVIATRPHSCSNFQLIESLIGQMFNRSIFEQVTIELARSTNEKACQNDSSLKILT